MTPGALMRATQMKENLRGLDELAERHSVDLRAALSPEMLKRIKGAMRTDWLPIAYDVEMNEAVERSLGRELLCRWSRSTIESSLKGPMLSPLLDGAVALFGLTPNTLFKLLPRGWGSVYRGCGELKIEGRGNTQARIMWRGVPDEVRASEPYLYGVAATFSALLAVTNAEGDVVPTVVPGNAIEFAAKWERIKA
jgi:hypothetical protein